MIKNKVFLLLFFISFSCFSQKYFLGDQLTPQSSKFKLIGISSSTGVSHYRYIGTITDTYFYNRRIDDIIVGVKNGIIVTTIYNLIPESGDIGVPKSLLDLAQSGLAFPLAERNGIYGVNIDNTSISISRTVNKMTFNKDRIMFLTSVKSSVLKQ